MRATYRVTLTPATTAFFIHLLPRRGSLLRANAPPLLSAVEWRTAAAQAANYQFQERVVCEGTSRFSLRGPQDRLKRCESPFCSCSCQLFKMAAAIASETPEATAELSGEAHSLQLSSGTGRAHRKSLKASVKSIKSKRSSKASSHYEKQKDKALKRIYKKAASKKASSSHSSDRPQHSQGQLILLLSPGDRQGREASLNPLFPIDVSGIWGLAQEFQTSLPARDDMLPPSVQRMDAIPSTSTAIHPDQPNPPVHGQLPRHHSQYYIAGYCSRVAATGCPASTDDPGRKTAVHRTNL